MKIVSFDLRMFIVGVTGFALLFTDMWIVGIILIVITFRIR